MEGEEKALDTRYKTAAAKLDAENKAARAEIAQARKALAREKGELASKFRNSAAEAEVAARKVRCWCVHGVDSAFSFACAGDSNEDGVNSFRKKLRSSCCSCSAWYCFQSSHGMLQTTLAITPLIVHSNLILRCVITCQQPTPTSTPLCPWCRLQHAEAESLMRRAREKERQGAEQDNRRKGDRYGKPILAE